MTRLFLTDIATFPIKARFVDVIVHLLIRFALLTNEHKTFSGTNVPTVRTGSYTSALLWLWKCYDTTVQQQQASRAMFKPFTVKRKPF